MYACVYAWGKLFSKILAVVAHLDACIYYLICKRTSWWLGHAGDVEHSVSVFLLRGLSKDRSQVAEQRVICSLFYSEKYSTILWVAFRVENCCFVINLKWVEYTGPYIVHSHLLRNFAFISTVLFLYSSRFEPYRILINYELPNLPSEVMFIIFFTSLISSVVLSKRFIFL